MGPRPNRARILKHIEQLERAETTASTPFELDRLLFKQQLPFGLDGSRYQTAVTPRRAGKTWAIAAKLLSVARAKRGCTALYITLSRLNAKRIVWQTLKEMNLTHGLGGEVLEADLCIRLPNGANIYLSGANDRSEVEKFRGMALGIVIIDEAQSFPGFLEQLVDEVLTPALTDYAGSICLVGTPGPVPIGYFHDKAHSPEWRHHTWSVFDNIHLAAKSGQSTQSLLDDVLKARGVTIEDPSIQREWFGRWALDVNSLVFRWDTTRNGRRAPKCAHHVISIDVGFDDADAIAVLGWNDDDPALYLVEELVMTKQTLTPLMAQVSRLYAQYEPQAVICDMGGLGKKLALTIEERTNIPIEAAEKQEKLAHIELLNDALRTDLMFAPADSRFAQDCLKVEWDRSNPEKPKISERFHSDICDAVLYGWRKCQQWLYVAPKPKAARLGTVEHAVEQQKREAQELEEVMEQEFEVNRQQQQERNQWESEEWQ
jgi:hypothetical protein